MKMSLAPRYPARDKPFLKPLTHSRSFRHKGDVSLCHRNVADTKCAFDIDDRCSVTVNIRDLNAGLVFEEIVLQDNAV